ncbi:MAG: hypothetical protein P8169_06550 [Chloroflexota bacterium]
MPEQRNEYQDDGVNRRSFIRNLSLAALAATAAGTGAAMLAGRQKGEVVFKSGPPDIVRPLHPYNLSRRFSRHGRPCRLTKTLPRCRR